MERYRDHAVIGIDAGGTKISGLLVAGGEIKDSFRLRTDISSQETVLGCVEEVIEKLLEKGSSRGLQVSALGIGVAGFIDFKHGVVTEAPNLPLRDLPLKESLKEKFRLSVVVDNDANVAALAEARWGAGRGSRHLVHLTLGTGIGGGIIVDGRLYRGVSGAGAELGHMIILVDGPPCNCGSRGCLEALASGTAIERMARERRLGGGGSPVLKRCAAEMEVYDAKMVTLAAEDGDETAVEILEEMGHYLGIGISNLINIFNPEVVTLSGGLLHAWPFFERSMFKAVEENAVPISRGAVQIRGSELGEEGGALGAALLALEETE